MATSSLSSFEKKEKDVLVNLARSVGSALGTVAAKTSAVTSPTNRRKAVKTAKKQVTKAGAKVKRQVAKARGQAKKVVRKVESSARKVRRKL